MKRQYIGIPINDLRREVSNFQSTDKLKRSELIDILIKNEIKGPDIKVIKTIKRPVFIKKIIGKQTKTNEDIFKIIENTPIIDKVLNFGESGKKLLSYQKSFVKSFNYSNIDGAVMIYGVGTGKTLTALASALRYLQLYTDNKVIFCTPKALVANWIDQIREIGIDPNYDKFIFTTYDQIIRRTIPDDIMHNALVIFDEAHIMRTHINEGFKADMVIDRFGEMESNVTTQLKSGIKTAKIITLNVQAHKTLLLTGTPFVNKIEDIRNLITLANQNIYIASGSEQMKKNTILDNTLKKKDKDGKWEWNIDNIHNYFDYKIDIFILKKDNPMYLEYPEATIKIEPIILTDKDEEQYEESKEQDAKQTAFYYSDRLAANTMNDEDNKKLKFIMKLIKTPIKGDDGKMYKRRVVIYSTFVNTMIKILKQLLTKQKIPYSEVTGNIKDSTKDYLDGKTNVFIISKAGTEGLNLLRTDDLVIYEPIFNDASIMQAMARGIRFKSHVGHHSNKITIYRLIAVFKREMPKFKKLLIDLKKIEDGTVDLDTFFNLYLNRHKDNNQLITFESIDPKLLLYSMYKQKYLIDFFELLEKNVIEVKEYHNKLLDKIEMHVKQHNKEIGKRLPIIEINKIMNKFILEETPKYIEKREKITIEKKKEITTKQINKLLQQYYTPPQIGNYLAKQIFKREINNNVELNILEPTAGEGQLIISCMNINSRRGNEGILIKYTLVEFDSINVKKLNETFKENPMVDIIQNDFMQFENGMTYDYILMNPPFNLKFKIKGKLLHDYDFITRAYDNFLKVDGYIFAIILYGHDKHFPEHIKKNVWHIEHIDFAKNKEMGEWVSNTYLKDLKISIVTIHKKPMEGDIIPIKKLLEKPIEIVDKPKIKFDKYKTK
jgi:predicted RNA methylase